MTDYLIMHRTTENDLDWRPVSSFYERKSAEVDQVIEEAAEAGEGEYIAVPLGSCTKRVAEGVVVLVEPEGG